MTVNRHSQTNRPKTQTKLPQVYSSLKAWNHSNQWQCVQQQNRNKDKQNRDNS